MVETNRNNKEKNTNAQEVRIRRAPFNMAESSEDRRAFVSSHTYLRITMHSSTSVNFKTKLQKHITYKS